MRTGLLADERLLVALRELDLVAAGLLAVVMDAGRLLAAPVEVDEGGHADRDEGERERHHDRAAHEGERHRYERQRDCGNDDGYGPHGQWVPALGRRKLKAYWPEGPARLV